MGQINVIWRKFDDLFFQYLSKNLNTRLYAENTICIVRFLFCFQQTWSSLFRVFSYDTTLFTVRFYRKRNFINVK